MTVVITVDIPTGLLLTENQRLHWRPKAERVKTVRQIAAYAKRQQCPDTALITARCVCTIWHARNARRDATNWLPTAKACVDGIATGPSLRPWAYALLPDDSDKYLTGPDMRSSDQLSPVPGYTRFVFTFTTEGPTHDRP